MVLVRNKYCKIDLKIKKNNSYLRMVQIFQFSYLMKLFCLSSLTIYCPYINPCDNTLSYYHAENAFSIISSIDDFSFNDRFSEQTFRSLYTCEHHHSMYTDRRISYYVQYKQNAILFGLITLFVDTKQMKIFDFLSKSMMLDNNFVWHLFPFISTWKQRHTPPTLRIHNNITARLFMHCRGPKCFVE